MKKRIILAAAALSLPCCFVSCESFTKADALRTLKAASIAALQGAIPAATTEFREIQAEKVTDGKTTVQVQP